MFRTVLQTIFLFYEKRSRERNSSTSGISTNRRDIKNGALKVQCSWQENVERSMVPLLMSLYKFHTMKSFGAIIELVFTDYLKEYFKSYL